MKVILKKAKANSMDWFRCETRCDGVYFDRSEQFIAILKRVFSAPLIKFKVNLLFLDWFFYIARWSLGIGKYFLLSIDSKALRRSP